MARVCVRVLLVATPASVTGAFSMDWLKAQAAAFQTKPHRLPNHVHATPDALFILFKKKRKIALSVIILLIDFDPQELSSISVDFDCGTGRPSILS